MQRTIVRVAARGEEILHLLAYRKLATIYRCAMLNFSKFSRMSRILAIGRFYTCVGSPLTSLTAICDFAGPRTTFPFVSGAFLVADEVVL